MALDVAALTAMASRPEWFHVAADADQITTVLRAIALTMVRARSAW